MGFRLSGIREVSFKLWAVLLAVIFTVGYYTYSQVFGDTTIGKTITTNTNLENGLVAHWTFDGPNVDWSSTTAEILDTSGNRNNGDTNPISAFAQLGKIGQGLRFDGGGAQVDCGDNTSLQPASVTLSAWIKPNANWTQYQFVAGMTQSSNWGGGFHFVSQAGGALQFSVNSYVPVGGSGGVVFGSQSDTPVGIWTHVVGTYDGSEIRLYKNGTFYDSASYSTPIDYSNSNCYLGYGGGANAYYNGFLDDVRVYDRALSEKEVQRLYELGGTTHIGTTITTNDELEDGLILHYTFDGPNMLSNVADSGGQGNHGYLVGQISTTTILGKIGQALQFDGANDYITTNVAQNWGTEYTVAFWLNVESYNSFDTIFKHGFSDSCSYQPSISLNSMTELYAAVSGCAGSGAIGSVAIKPGWNHITVTVDGSTNQTIYVNGASSTSSRRTVNASSVHTVIGANETANNGIGNSAFFNGSLDDVRVYNRALSSTEVQRLYDLGATTHIGKTITAGLISSGESSQIGHWTFDGSGMDWSSTTAEVLDASGNGNTGNVTGFNSGSAIIGKIGQAIQFDGIDDVVDMGDIYEDLNAVTLSAWVKRGDYTALAGGVLGRSTHCGLPSSEDEFIMEIADNTWDGMQGVADRVWIRTGHLSDTSFHSIGAIAEGRFYHLAFTYDGSVKSIYINGELDTTENATGTLGSSACGDAFRIGYGRGLSNGSYYFHGLIDDARIYNRALSETEIKKLYELGS